MASESVLLVDDEEDILELVGYSLTKNGYSVTGVTSGEIVRHKNVQEGLRGS